MELPSYLDITNAATGKPPGEDEDINVSHELRQRPRLPLSAMEAADGAHLARGQQPRLELRQPRHRLTEELCSAR